MPYSLFVGRPFSFGLKCLGALCLVVLADLLFYDKSLGSTLGVFALVWTVVVAGLLPNVRKHRTAQIALACACAFGCVLLDAPGFLASCLFWIALSSAVLLPWIRFRNAGQFALRILAQGANGLGKMFRDAIHLLRLPRLRLRNCVLLLAATFAVPLTGTVIFLALFANANPVVEQLLSAIPLPSWDWLSPLRCIFWILMAVVIWPTLRPSRAAIVMKFSNANKPLNLPGVSIVSIILSLAMFNLIFAVQNGLDAAFLWSGAPLPDGITIAEYVHRGAYPLIVTALLAGVFVLVTARPDSDIGRNRLVQQLVVLWIAQNLLLVASSAVRTCDYIGTYMMTGLRIAALIWMALVAVSLVLICWRMIARLALSWLINAIALATAIVLGSVSVIDLDNIAAGWNVTHAREVGGKGQPLDLGYMRALGTAALVPLALLETKKLEPGFRDRVAYVRAQIAAETYETQHKPHGWIWRNARRLDAMNVIIGPRPYVAQPLANGREWDGTPVEPRAGTVPLTPPGGQ